MAQSLCKIYLHIIFHVKTCSPNIDEQDLEHVHSYIGHLINVAGCQSIRVGGVSDHVHVVCLLSRNQTVSHLVEEMKRPGTVLILLNTHKVSGRNDASYTSDNRADRPRSHPGSKNALPICAP